MGHETYPTEDIVMVREVSLASSAAVDLAPSEVDIVC